MIPFRKADKRLQLEYKLAFIHLLKKFKSFPVENQILIFSEARGRNTWLAEMIHTLPHTAAVWKPLNIHEVKSVKKPGIGCSQYIPEEQI